MTPEEHKSYEEAADDYWLTIGDTFSLEIGRYVKTAYQKGCEHAHKRKYELFLADAVMKIEAAEREAHNKAKEENEKLKALLSNIRSLEKEWESSLKAKEQECEELKERCIAWSFRFVDENELQRKEVLSLREQHHINEYAKAFADQEKQALKEEYNALGIKFDKETERWQERDVSVRAENDRLKELINQNEREGIIYGTVNARDEINSLRKRCEDLEAALKEYHDWHLRGIEAKFFSPAFGAPIRAIVKKLLSDER